MNTGQISQFRKPAAPPNGRGAGSGQNASRELGADSSSAAGVVSRYAQAKGKTLAKPKTKAPVR